MSTVTETIVVGFVRTPEGQAALDVAVQEASRRGARLIIVHSAHGDETGAQIVADREALDTVTGRAKAAGVDVDVHDFARGQDPTTDLLAVVEERHADLIVIGLRRRSPVGKLIMGSHAQEILLGAPCPVLAVKAAN